MRECRRRTDGFSRASTFAPRPASAPAAARKRRQSQRHADARWHAVHADAETSNSTLAWSTDHAVTWTWGFTFDTSFGCPAFLNFGRNYAGARDDYVYIYSQDGPGAYDPYDDIVMARVPKSKIRERTSYEFFAGPGSDARTIWDADMAKRAPVFHFPGSCAGLMWCTIQASAGI